MAGNQSGKTLCAGAETSMHTTGRYPDWWEGRRFTRPVHCWVAGVTSEGTRDNPQRMLLGRVGDRGAGMIPEDCIGQVRASRGAADGVDTATVRHISGGFSTINFKSYDQGREKWQGETLDFVWFDEEPPPDIYSEGLTRTNAGGDVGESGMVFITFTPLLGMTDVVNGFYPEPAISSRHLTMMTIDDVDHYTAEQRQSIVASYAPHEREARAKGIPILGSGRVFPIPESELVIEPFDIPDHWARICGLDFGWDHPTAAVWCAWDRDRDVWVVYDCYKAKERVPLVHAAAMRTRGSWIPVAWPHDGYVHDKGSGSPLALQYRTHGLLMLPEHAAFEDGGYGVEAGIMQMSDAMTSQRFKVFSTLENWWQEFRTYHRKDGKIVKKNDDIMAATRYAWMCKRYARTQTTTRAPTNLGMTYDPFQPTREVPGLNFAQSMNYDPLGNN